VATATYTAFDPTIQHQLLFSFSDSMMPMDQLNKMDASESTNNAGQDQILNNTTNATTGMMPDSAPFCAK
jgi:hypothetical protein